MKKRLIILSCIAILLVLVSLVSTVLITAGYVPHLNWILLIVAPVILAFIILLIILVLRRM